MSEKKIGNEVLIRGKIEEIRETKDGKRYKIYFGNKNMFSETIIISEKDIVAK